MQKLYRTILLTPLLFLSACPSVPSDLRLAESGCRDARTTLVAKDAGKSKNPRDMTFLSIKPDTVVVDEGCFIIINNPGKHTFTTTPVNPAATWLNGRTTEAPLVLGPAKCKTSNACDDVDDLYKFEIKVHGIGVLDPRARVL